MVGVGCVVVGGVGGDVVAVEVTVVVVSVVVCELVTDEVGVVVVVNVVVCEDVSVVVTDDVGVLVVVLQTRRPSPLPTQCSLLTMSWDRATLSPRGVSAPLPDRPNLPGRERE